MGYRALLHPVTSGGGVRIGPWKRTDRLGTLPMTGIDRTTHLSALASSSACPHCAHDQLEFVLRCDLGYGPCLYTARCASCNSSFEIVLSEAELAPDDLRDAIGPCPECGNADRTATLHCSERTHACVYHVSCALCGFDEGE